MREVTQQLESAWSFREKKGLLQLSSLRVFHGPGEGSGELARFAIDRFEDRYWVTEWESQSGANTATKSKGLLSAISDFLSRQGAISAVALPRPEKGVPANPVALFGAPTEERLAVREGDARFRIQLMGTRHPGLFLDHYPLRLWLKKSMRGLKVLNTFAYTGSLSVAAGLGGAVHVTTLDLSQPTISWAKENWETNALSADARFIAGDYFEWLPRLKREGALFDCVILDPPSFSRGKKGAFSTAKDLKRLHALAFSVLASEGYLVSSINSANVPRKKFEADVLEAAKESRVNLKIVDRISLPETFPTVKKEDSYLKGIVARKL